MSDLRQHLAGDDGSIPPLDMGAVRTRAAQLGRRRRTAQAVAASVAVALGVAGITGVVLTGRTGGPDALVPAAPVESPERSPLRPSPSQVPPSPSAATLPITPSPAPRSPSAAPSPTAAPSAVPRPTASPGVTTPSTSPSAPEPGTRQCENVGFEPNTDNVAGQITATGTTCENARALVRRTYAEHNREAGPFIVGRYSCTVRSVEPEFGLPRREYDCRAPGGVRVTWNKT